MEGRRLQNYKNKGNTTDELRKRREEEGVQIRKNKRNEMLQKRRLCADPPAQQTPPTSNLVSTSIDRKIENFYNNCDPNIHHTCICDGNIMKY